MNKNRFFQEKGYFDLRNSKITDSLTSEAKLPSYILNILPEHKNSPILDIGCGFGGLLLELRKLGYTNIHGVDINDEAIAYCSSIGMDVKKIDSIGEYSNSHTSEKYELIIMTHVIEHIKKDAVIDTLLTIRSLLKDNGALYLTTPNAQARSGAYWAYEDFTHDFIFTSGSLYYVLKAAGFTTVAFLDKDNIENSKFKLLKKLFLAIYKAEDRFWNKITGAAYHPMSPIIYSWELKVLGKK
jgi:2-polyprenyl-3-methyl-5-hydroxy-6-metoxy-1,4-benzoquinol methylase